jgi:hypothetical protein
MSTSLPKHLLLWVLLFASMSLLSCGPSKTIVKDSGIQPLPPSSLDAHFFHSPVGDLAGHYPNGWLLVNMENLPDFSNVLFVYSDPARENALVLSEIPGTAELRRNVERDGLTAIAQASFLLKSEKTHGKVSMIREPELFTQANKLFASYEYSSADSGTGGQLQDRAVVFTTGIRFYELAMVELLPDKKQADDRKTENFRLLQSVIGALDGPAEIRKLAPVTSDE